MKGSDMAILAGVGLLAYTVMKNGATAAPTTATGTQPGTGLQPINYGYQYSGAGYRYASGAASGNNGAGGGLSTLIGNIFGGGSNAGRNPASGTGGNNAYSYNANYSYNYGGGGGGYYI